MVTRYGDPVSSPRREAGRLAGNARGASRAGCLLAIAVFLVLGYGAVEIIGAEIDYRSLSSQVQRTARVARETPDEGMAAQVQAKAAELGLPPAAGAATIRRLPGDRVAITVTYPDTIWFFDRFHWVRNRRIHVEQAY